MELLSVTQELLVKELAQLKEEMDKEKEKEAENPNETKVFVNSAVRQLPYRVLQLIRFLSKPQ
jgi:hypothetical protein